MYYLNLFSVNLRGQPSKKKIGGRRKVITQENIVIGGWRIPRTSYCQSNHTSSTTLSECPSVHIESIAFHILSPSCGGIYNTITKHVMCPRSSSGGRLLRVRMSPSHWQLEITAVAGGDKLLPWASRLLPTHRVRITFVDTDARAGVSAIGA